MSRKNPLPVPDFFPNKRVMPEANKMSVKDLLRYQSLEEQKIASSVRNYRAALPYLAGLGAGMLLVKLYTDSLVKSQIFGENSTSLSRD